MTKSAKIPRNATSGTFVLGQRVFRKISAVEGIKPSKQLNADLQQVMHLPPEQRRSILYAKYGKRG
ncbi:hypothetical protein JDN40_04225 [Rhodomicrobium vannielii ATCC 17100]|uniref:hypothetical protein n=1 Tax=Rhodomicrobium vannielii TaxID=1069 RepID=UPI001918D825|nr:hypothetical protein [Rhodomicrobium vannielii]MBJ7533314.1 hypothetical protein [Rhodomicrobium vannielii ATCC 17100]